MRMTRKQRRTRQRKKRMLAASKSLLKRALHTSLSAALFALTYTTSVRALPSDGQVTGGSAIITRTADTMTINQSTAKLSINWDKFNIDAHERVNFVQPSAQSVVLNRVVGQDPSRIYGALTANGQVFLLNPNGIVFAPGASVDVGGLVASTLTLTDQDFAKGNYVFNNPGGMGAVTNSGIIRAKQGGYVVLAGSQVDNSGAIAVSQGTIALAAGGQLKLDVPGEGKIGLAVSQPEAQAAAANSGSIRADGGQVIMLGRASDAMLSAVVNNTGIVEAKSLSNHNGVIRLDGGSSGVVQNAGVLDASGRGAGETGGAISLTGDKVGMVSGAVVDASGAQGGGTVLIGGNYQGQGPEQNATSAYLAAGATIKADAIQKGDGGKVVVWANDTTGFYGNISAQGGGEGGNGGLVETSGKNCLDAQGSVNASAVNGKAGLWLLDPRNVIIKSGGGSGTSGEPNFTAVSDNAVVTTESIATALNGGTSVSVNTGYNGLQDGNITITSHIAKTSGGDATLTLNAANSIIVSSGIDISSTSGKLNLDFRADGQYGGYIQLGSNSRLATNGGTIDLYGGGGLVFATGSGINSGSANLVIQTNGAMKVGGDITGTGSMAIAGGNITFDGGTISGGAGNISVTGDVLTFNAGSDITGGSGTVSLTGNSITLNDDSNIGGSRQVVLTANSMTFNDQSGITGNNPAATLTLRPGDVSSRIALGTDSSGGLQIDSTQINRALKGSFDQLIIGRTEGSNEIAINDFAAPADLKIQSPVVGGSVTVDGVLNMRGHELEIDSYGDISQTQTGALQNVGILHAASDAGAIDLGIGTTSDGAAAFANTIDKLGSISADKSISIGAGQTVTSLDSTKDGLILAGPIHSSTGQVLIRTTGNLTIGEEGIITTGSSFGDIYLSAEGTYAHFFNKSDSGANALQPGSGRWLIYSYSPLADNAIPNNPGYSSPGSSSAIDILGGLNKDFKYYNYTFNDHNPGSVIAPSYNLSGKRGLLYAYAPVISLDTAERTYGYGKTTIQYTFGGLIGEDANDVAMKAAIASSISNSDNILITSNEATNAGTYVNGITAIGQTLTDAGYMIPQGETVDLVIKPREITVTANAASKIYDGTAAAPSDWNAANAFTLTSGSFYSSETYNVNDTAANVISGKLMIQGNPVNAGSYNGAIVSDTLDPLHGNQNYNITVNPGNYTIYKRPIMVNGLTADNKVYDGATTASIRTAGAFLDGVVEGDDIHLNVGGASGRFVNKNAGNNQTVYISGLTISGTAMGNYSLSNADAYTTTADILRRPVNVVAAAAGKVYGDADPALVYTTSGNGDGLSGLVPGESLNGALGRAAGENAATYAILQGTVDNGHNSNYNIAYTSADFVIAKADLTVTAADKSKVYGDANPGFTYTITGFKNNEDSTSAHIQGAPELATVANEGSNVGQYDISIHQGTLSADNYNFTNLIGGKLTISKRPVTIHLGNVTKTYGSADPVLTYTITGIPSFVDNGFSGLPTRAAGENAGSYAFQLGSIKITRSGVDKSANYDFTFQSPNLTILPKTLTVTADAKSKTYGDSDPALTYSVSGWVNNSSLGINDTGLSLTGSLSRAAGENAGSYQINQNTLAAPNGNYTVSYTGNQLTIDKADLHVTAQSATKTYGQNDPALTFTADVINNAVVHDSVDGVLTGSLSRAAGETVDGGPYAIDQGTLALAGSSPNYNLLFDANNAKLTITPKTLTVTADAKSKTYGDSDPALTYSVSGWVNNSSLGINDAGLSLTGSLSRAAGENAGSYQVNQNTLAAPNNNYTVSYTGSQLLINRADLMITVDSKTREYGDANPALTASYSGLKRGDNASVISGLQLSTAADQLSNVGDYAITANGANAENYNIFYKPGTLAITPATLIYRANLAARDFGMVNPALSGTVYGFKNGETLATATRGKAIFTTTASVTTIPGQYAITGSGLTTNHGNYIFEQHPDNAVAFTIKPVNPELDISKNQAKQLGKPDAPGNLPDPNRNDPVIEGQTAVHLLQSDSSENKEPGDATKRWEGISIPVFLIQGDDIAPEGLYNVSYSGDGLKLVPSPQKVPAPPAVSEAGSRTLLYLTLADGRQAVYNVISARGVISIEANSHAARESLQDMGKELRKQLIANAVLAAVNDLSVLPGQIQAVFIRK